MELKPTKILAIILLAIIIYFFLNKIYLEIVDSPLILNVTIGSNNLQIVLITLFLFVVGIILLMYLNKNFNLRVLVSEFLKFIFLMVEIIIVALTGLTIFISIKQAPETTLVDFIGRPIYFICIALFLFITTRIMKQILTKKDIIIPN